MRHTRTVEVPATTCAQDDGRSCDFCNFRSMRPGADWAGQKDGAYSTAYTVNRTTLEYEAGTVYPEGGTTRLQRVDMCPMCWATKFVPWCEGMGVRVTTIDEDTH